EIAGATAVLLTEPQPSTGQAAVGANGAGSRSAIPHPAATTPMPVNTGQFTEAVPPQVAAVPSAAAGVRSSLAPSTAGAASHGFVPLATVAGTGGITALVRSPLVRRMLEVVLAEPILLSPDERYLTGHYLAYLMSGSRRQGLFLRRPLEPRNADRARL